MHRIPDRHVHLDGVLRTAGIDQNGLLVHRFHPGVNIMAVESRQPDYLPKPFSGPRSSYSTVNGY